MILSVAGLEFRYNSRPVLDAVSFRLAPGQVMAVLGVNGAGKSTLLKCVNRVLRPINGSVFLDGQDVLRMRRTDVAKRIGYVPQKHGDEPMTVFEAVLLGRRPHIKWAVTEADYRVVANILGLMSLEEFALRPVGSLSGGETQKVVLARALAQEPDLLLLDEPTSNLDLKNQIEVMTLVSATVRKRGLSALIALHDLNLALRFADWYLLLKDGRVHALVDRSGITPDAVHEVYGVSVVLAEIEGYPVVVPLNRG
jgi:iron complex transport system ATP-binding protein